MQAAVHCVRSFGRPVFLTVGRQQLAEFAALDDQWFFIRAIDVPDGPLPPRHELVLQRPSFGDAEEIALMRSRSIDLLVTKNSGGAATYAKIPASRALRVPVAMMHRPELPATPAVDSLAAAVAWIDELLQVVQ